MSNQLHFLNCNLCQENAKLSKGEKTVTEWMPGDDCDLHVMYFEHGFIGTQQVHNLIE